MVILDYPDYAAFPILERMFELTFMWLFYIMGVGVAWKAGLAHYRAS